MTSIYSKDSFDRFGDDLYELLFSYLSFEEKFRKECVSKQWQRLVFNKQKLLSIDLSDIWRSDGSNENVVNCNVLKKILIKCQFIDSISVDREVENREGVFQLIVKYCHNLTHIETDFKGVSEKTFKEFFHKFGSKLKSIAFHTDVKRNKEALIECQKLTSVNIKPIPSIHYREYQLINNISLIFNDCLVLVNNLKHISFNYSVEDFNRIRIFVANNKNSLESIRIGFNYEEECNLSTDELNAQKQSLFNELVKLSKLKTLHINSNLPMNPKQTFVNFLIQLSYNCPELKKIKLNVDKHNCAQVLQAINGFRNLKYLSIGFSATHEQYSYTCEALNELKSLTHLTIEDDISDDFFDNIHIHLPKLQHIYCPTHNALSIRILDVLSKLSDLRSIGLYAYNSKSEINKSVVLDLIEKCPKINGFKNKYKNREDNDSIAEESDVESSEYSDESSGDEVISIV